MDDEILIREILNDIKIKKIKTIEEIEEEKKIILENIYDKFFFYDINKKNKEETSKRLEEYKYIDSNNLNRGDYIMYINEKYFYNITLNKGGFITKIDVENNILEIINNNIYSKIKIDTNIFFKKIDRDESIKLSILENLN